MSSKKTNLGVSTLMGTAMGVILALTTVVEGQPTGRLLVPGPADGAGGFLNTIHEYDLATREMSTFGPPPDKQFPQNPVSVTMCPDGLLYVGLAGSGGVYKLDPVTGETLDVLPIPTGGLLCLPDGNLLVLVGLGLISEYLPDGSYVGPWVDLGSGWSNNVRSLRLTPQGTVGFTVGHPGPYPGYPGVTKLVEYDLDGSFLREVIPPSTDNPWPFAFLSDTEILVSHVDSRCIRRYDWTTTPATFLSDFVPCDPGNTIVLTLVVTVLRFVSTVHA